MSGVSLEVQDLCKSWGTVDVLHDVSFSIEAGGFLTLLGPSGCGKSTILRLVSGLDEANSGQIRIDGKEISNVPAAQRNVGMVFQNYALFPHLTIAENITYGLRIRKVAKAERQKALARVAELMALGSLLDRKPAQLSGGQQQRVALARVLVSDRPLVLMDEPLSNLDAKLRAEIRSEIRSLNKQLGITVVYVTHDQSEALSMSDRVVLMDAGRVAQWGAPVELYKAPANIFAASFIGTPPMNLIDATEVRMPEAFAPAGINDSLVGVRPEQLQFPSNAQPFSLSARVEAIEYEGSVSLVHLQTQSGKRLIVSHAGDETPNEGEEISVGWDYAATHLFSKSSGHAVPFEN